MSRKPPAYPAAHQTGSCIPFGSTGPTLNWACSGHPPHRHGPPHRRRCRTCLQCRTSKQTPSIHPPQRAVSESRRRGPPGASPAKPLGYSMFLTALPPTRLPAYHRAIFLLSVMCVCRMMLHWYPMTDSSERETTKRKPKKQRLLGTMVSTKNRTRAGERCVMSDAWTATKQAKPKNQTG